jgi:DNA-binding NarL/FixJ family response regulator
MIGRDDELGRLGDALERLPGGAGAVVLEGEAGIGKTILWESALADAEARGYRVLRTSGAQSEVQLLLGALGDLLQGLHEVALEPLPAPQRHALAVALLLEESTKPPDLRALAVAFLGVLRELAADGPVVVAVDDVQWLDPTTLGLLTFAARRLSSEPVLLLLARRVGGEHSETELERAIAADRLERIDVGPLTLGALGVLLRDRLGVGFPRPVLLRLHETSGGNPFFALELARALERRGYTGAPGHDVPVPLTLRALVRERLDALPPDVSDALLVVAAAAEPTLPLLGGVDIEPAVAAGVVEVDGERVRFTHPLLAATIVEDAPPARLREVHARLAELVTDPERRARHRAAAATGPDESVAAALEDATHAAFRRGAPAAAGELLERALVLTDPTDDAARARRAGQAGRYYSVAGDGVRGAELMRLGIELSVGHERAVAIWLLLDSTANTGDPVQLGAEALAHADDDAELRARLHSALSEVHLVRGEVRVAYEHARAARELAAGGADELLRVFTLGRAANLETLLGEGDPDATLREALELEHALTHAHPSAVTSPRNHLGRRRFWQDDLDAARALFEALRLEAIASYADDARPNVCLYLARIELRAGRFELARGYADEAFELAEHAGYTQVIGGSLSVRALVAAHLGDVDTARAQLAESAAVGASVDDRWHELHNRVTVGLLETSLGRHEEAVAAVGELGEELDRLGIAEPGIFPFELDAIEALVAVGRLEDAGRAIGRQAMHARPRMQAVAAHGRALVLAAHGDIDAALAAFDEALLLHDALGDPLLRARTLLALGAVLRRARRKREARDRLDEALAAFAELGATAFEARARDELERLSGRRTEAGLTPTESRVAELVAQGLSNKQVAAELVVSVKAVEAHLTRIYAKLGVHSRAELARALAAKV